MNHAERHDRTEYYKHMLLSVIVVELLAILAFNYWPFQGTSPVIVFPAGPGEIIMLSETPVTELSGAPPAHPSVPVPVIDDRLIPDPLTNLQVQNRLLSKIPLDEAGNGGGGQSGEGRGKTGGGGGFVKLPARPPTIVKIVEPAMPPEARRTRLQAEILVNFLVDTTGSAQKVSIAQIRLYNRDTKRWQVVSELGYGVIQATLEAAAQWRFRPAENDGHKVSTITQHVFTFGN